MVNYIYHRLLQAIPVLIGISVLTFAMLHLVPGDPVTIFAGDKPLTEERAGEIRHQLGLDRPLWVQYWDYASHAVRGDLGVGLRSRRPVVDSVLEVLPSTLELTFAALLHGGGRGHHLGHCRGGCAGHLDRHASHVVCDVGNLDAGVLFQPALDHVFFVPARLVPGDRPGGVERLVLPATALGLTSAAAIARLVRSSMLEVLGQDYIVTARAKGLSGRAVIMRHALKNALIPTITMLGLQLGVLLGGAVVTETIFSRPGLGRLAVDAITSRDFPLIQGVVLFAAVTYVLVNLIVDVLYAAIDPRIRYNGSH